MCGRIDHVLCDAHFTVRMWMTLLDGRKKNMDEMKRIDRVLKYKGAIVDVYDDVMQSPSGNIAHWDYVAHRKGAAAVLPVTEDGKILRVRQYRNALDRETLEIPAGSRDSVEEPTSVCAARELEEETGYKAAHLELLITVSTTVAFCNETIDVYLATDLTKTQQHLDGSGELYH